MHALLKQFALILLSALFIGCYADGSLPPDFKDGDNTINQLQSKYQCEEIEFENWEDDDKDDSTLTVCLVNSKLVPSSSPDESNSEFKKIASLVKHSLRKPDQYKSYYVIFVKRENKLGRQSRAHSAGSDISSKDL